MSALTARLRDLFSLDARSMAAARIMLAVLSLVDLGARAVDLPAHYTDWGLLPRWVQADMTNTWFLSIHMWGGNLLSQAILWVAHALAALALLVGYRTRLASFVTWFLLISLHARNPMVLDGGDVAFRMLLFWGMFAPWGSVWSIDRIRTGALPVKHWFGAASVAWILQMSIVYWQTAWLKSAPEWRSEFTAVYYALNWDGFATDFGLWLRQFPDIMRMLTIGTIVLEAVGPFLLYLPWGQAYWRTLTVVLFVGLHAGFGLCMELGVFPFIMMAGWIALLPGWFWDTVKVRGRNWFRGGEVAWRPYSTRLASTFCALALVWMLAWNIREFDFNRMVKWIPREINPLAHILRLDQKWDMFSPRPGRDDGWYVIPAVLANGNKVDLLHGATPTWDKPPYVAGHYVNQRWRKYLMNIWMAQNVPYRLHYGRYLCRAWNESHPKDQELLTFEIYFMLEQTQPPGERVPLQRSLTWKHRCK